MQSLFMMLALSGFVQAFADDPEPTSAVASDETAAAEEGAAPETDAASEAREPDAVDGEETSASDIPDDAPATMEPEPEPETEPVELPIPDAWDGQTKAEARDDYKDAKNRYRLSEQELDAAYARLKADKADSKLARKMNDSDARADAEHRIVDTKAAIERLEAGSKKAWAQYQLEWAELGLASAGARFDKFRSKLVAARDAGAESKVLDKLRGKMVAADEDVQQARTKVTERRADLAEL